MTGCSPQAGIDLVSPPLSPSLRELLERPDAERRIGPFLLVRQLGRGGFAPVWFAREVYEGMEVRPAAVKLFAIPPRGAPGAAAQREQIIREARALCQVEHPNVVRFFTLIHDDARDIAGLAMEHVAGEALDRRLDRGKLGSKEALEVGIAMASALAAVHGAGLVHRDVKPANVVDAGGVFKLIDFGIAAAGAEARLEAAPTRAAEAPLKRVMLDDLPLEVLGTNMSMLLEAMTSDVGSSGGSGGLAVLSSGTVGYMDPEGVTEGAAAAPASDLYSLGALLFECLTGKLPAVAAMPEGGGMKGEVLDGRAEAPPVASLEPGVPNALAKLVDVMLKPRRADRPASAKAVRDELTRIRRELASPMSAMRAASDRGDGAREERESTREAGANAGAGVAGAPDGSRDPGQGSRRSRIARIGALAALIGVVVAGSVIGVRRATQPSVCSMGDGKGCAEQCDRGEVRSCYHLGVMTQNGAGASKDEARAADLFLRACDGGVAIACLELGLMFEREIGVTRDYARAAELYKRGCDAGEAQSCNLLGILYNQGRGVAVDMARAAELYARSCDGGYPSACGNLGIMYERGEGVVAADAVRARELYERACGLGSTSACGALAFACDYGIGGPKDEARAAELYKKACDGGFPPSCHGLATLLEQGRGVQKDEARAAELYKKACDAKTPTSCAMLGKLHLRGGGVPKDALKAFSFFQRACDGGERFGCVALAGMFAEGVAVAKDEARAAALYKQACDGGDAAACSQLDASGALAPVPSPSASPAPGRPVPHPAPAIPVPMPAPASPPPSPSPIFSMDSE